MRGGGGGVVGCGVWCVVCGVWCVCVWRGRGSEGSSFSADTDGLTDDFLLIPREARTPGSGAPQRQNHRTAVSVPLRRGTRHRRAGGARGRGRGVPVEGVLTRVPRDLWQCLCGAFWAARARGRHPRPHAPAEAALNDHAGWSPCNVGRPTGGPRTWLSWSTWGRRRPPPPSVHGSRGRPGPVDDGGPSRSLRSAGSGDHHAEPQPANDMGVGKDGIKTAATKASFCENTTSHGREVSSKLPSPINPSTHTRERSEAVGRRVGEPMLRWHACVRRHN